jgi:hypothetical protein
MKGVVNSIQMKLLFTTIILLISTVTVESGISKEKTKSVIGTFPEFIDEHYSDPPCDCLFKDDFAIVEKGNGNNISFFDPSQSYMNTYYDLYTQHDEEEWPGYGGATYKLKVEFIGKEFTITYKSALCPGYKDCGSGKMYKNMIITIK